MGSSIEFEFEFEFGGVFDIFIFILLILIRKIYPQIKNMKNKKECDDNDDDAMTIYDDDYDAWR